jgi:hypothetical protein
MNARSNWGGATAIAAMLRDMNPSHEDWVTILAAVEQKADAQANSGLYTGLDVVQGFLLDAFEAMDEVWAVQS